MPYAAKKTRPRRAWTPAELKSLKRLAKDGRTGAQIAVQLKRTVGAVYQHAYAKGVSLRGR